MASTSKETITASNPPSPSGSATSRWKLLSGEHFYTLVRWITLLLLFAVTRVLRAGSPIWPPTPESDPLVIVLWAYTAFSLFAAVAVFIPGVANLFAMAYIVDLLFISLMTFLGGEQNVIFFPLYLFPLINAAIRQPALVSLLSGITAAVFYTVAFIGWRRFLVAGTDLGLLDFVALGLRGITLSFVPWITSGMAERWSENNRASVVQAHDEVDLALQDARAYRDQMRSLYEVAFTLSTTVDYQLVLEATLRESRKLVPFNAGLVLLSSGQPDELFVAASQSVSIADQTLKVVVGHALSEALRSPSSTIITDIAKEADLQRFEALRTCRSACLMPLRANLRTYGLMVVASESPTAFRPAQVENLTALANYAIIALHNAQLIFDLKAERNKLISKEEEVRHQLARDLHDGPAQALAAITMNLEFIKRLLERDPSRIVEELEKLSAMSKRTTYEVRTMLFELRPLVLESQGLKVTLEQYLERFKGNNAGSAIVLELTNGAEDVHLDTKSEGTLFNIIQEAINNALKHAKAKHIWVRLRLDGRNLIAVVQDDGMGFDMKSVMSSYERRGSFGLLNIDERARLVGGSAELVSTIGQGTVVTIIVPIGK